MFLLKFSLSIFLSGILLFFAFPWSSCAAVRTYKIGGTGGALATMRLLAGEYKKSHPDISIQVLPSLGTTGGIRALSDGALDLCLAARPLNAKELSSNFTYRPYAETAIVFATSRCNEISRLGTREIAAILSGTVRYWPDGTFIRLVMRSLTESDFVPVSDSSSELRSALQVAARRTDTVFAPTAQDNANILESLPGSFGITSLAQVISEHVAVKPLIYNGIEASLANLENGTYPLKKAYALVYRDSNLDTALKDFLDFIFSEAACRRFRETGHRCIGGQ